MAPGKAGAEVKYEEKELKLSSAAPQTDPEEGHQDRGRTLHVLRAGDTTPPSFPDTLDRKRGKTKSKEANREINTADQTRCNTVARTVEEVVELRGGECSMCFSETLQLKVYYMLETMLEITQLKGETCSLLRKSGKINRFHVLKGVWMWTQMC